MELTLCVCVSSVDDGEDPLDVDGVDDVADADVAAGVQFFDGSFPLFPFFPLRGGF